MIKPETTFAFGLQKQAILPQCAFPWAAFQSSFFEGVQKPTLNACPLRIPIPIRPEYKPVHSAFVPVGHHMVKPQFVPVKAAEAEPVPLPFSTQVIGSHVTSSNSPNKETIDDKLDFILSSAGRGRKIVDHVQKPVVPRRRKTRSQLEFLQQTVEKSKLTNIDKQTIKFLSEQTGLKEVQIYKWYWDYKRKDKATKTSGPVSNSDTETEKSKPETPKGAECKTPIVEAPSNTQSAEQQH